MKKIATIMAVYHADDPSDFRTALDSVLAQQFTNPVESRIYLAVDGPVPEELEVELNNVEPLLHRLVRLDRNRGLAHALNSLISRLEDEEFVFRMDADDLSMPTRYQSQLEFFNRSPEIGILGTDMVEFDRVDGNQRTVSFSRDPEQARDWLHWRVPVAHPTVCFRRNVLNDVGGYPEVPYNEDIALWFRCAEQGYMFGNVPEPLYRFKIDERFWSRRSAEKAFWEWRCYTIGGMRLHGLSWKLFLPTVRLALRLSPKWLQKWAYGSSIRRPWG